jgi:hypothetical protein
MGYTPGDFHCRRRGSVHWEQKDGPRVVLWEGEERWTILDLDEENFRKAYEQMRTIAMILGIE